MGGDTNEHLLSLRCGRGSASLAVGSGRTTWGSWRTGVCRQIPAVQRAAPAAGHQLRAIRVEGLRRRVRLSQDTKCHSNVVRRDSR